MTWFRKPLILLLALGLGSSVLAAKKDGEDADKDAPKSEKKKKDKDKDKKKDGKDGKPATPSPEEAEKNAKRIQVPVPPGHDAKGLVIPYRNAEGKMQMRFTMELGTRVDLDHMDMTTLRIETFDEEGGAEMTIDLPRSVLDLNTRVISTENGVTVKRSDFELTGKAMVFNTETREGRVKGSVRMLIYNLDNETNSTPEETTPEK